MLSTGADESGGTASTRTHSRSPSPSASTHTTAAAFRRDLRAELEELVGVLRENKVSAVLRSGLERRRYPLCHRLVAEVLDRDERWQVRNPAARQ